uniref:Uncharacterized protein n=1 Tax=Rhizophora mucronata TaxID=61149 RepID=A0A2P2PQ97_RHIMU
MHISTTMTVFFTVDSRHSRFQPLAVNLALIQCLINNIFLVIGDLPWLESLLFLSTKHFKNFSLFRSSVLLKLTILSY